MFRSTWYLSNRQVARPLRVESSFASCVAVCNQGAQSIFQLATAAGVFEHANRASRLRVCALQSLERQHAEASSSPTEIPESLVLTTNRISVRPSLAVANTSTMHCALKRYRPGLPAEIDSVGISLRTEQFCWSVFLAMHRSRNVDLLRGTLFAAFRSMTIAKRF